MVGRAVTIYNQTVYRNTASRHWIVLSLALFSSGCAVRQAQRGGTESARGLTGSARPIQELRDLRSCDDVGKLDRPQAAGNCVPLATGGFVGLLASSRTTDWQDWDSHHGEYSTFQLWIYQPPAPKDSKQGVADPSSTPEVLQHLSWPEKEDCKNGASDGGGESDQQSCSLLLAHDLDGDGKLEILIERVSREQSAGCCSPESRQKTYSFYSLNGTQLVPHPRLPEISGRDAVLSVRDFDGDGTPDVEGTLDYKIPAQCAPPSLLLHAVPGQGLVRDDAVAKQAARSWCPRPPVAPSAALSAKELARYILCARMWGQSAQEVKTHLDLRCRTSESTTVDSQGQEHHPYPWAWCYQSGIECETPEVRDFCGPWVGELIEAPPPLRF